MSAKKTTNKPAAKKPAVKKPAAKKTDKKPTPKKETKFIPYDPDTAPRAILKRRTDDLAGVQDRMALAVRESVEVICGKSKVKPISHLSPSQMRKLMVPQTEITAQAAIGSIGFRTPTVMKLVAPDGVGKTTWIFSEIGKLAELGCYSVYVECEAKTMEPSHMKRLLHRDKATANRIFNTMSTYKARQLIECDNVIREALKDLRKRCDADAETKGNPIFIFLDPWSGLMSTTEAQGRSDWGIGAGEKKKALKESGQGSNMGHSKHAQNMKRWLPALLEECNATAVFVLHQNARVEMGAKSPVVQSESTNTTSIGGRALEQLAAYVFTMVHVKELKNADKTVSIGSRVKVTLTKNSYGPKKRSFAFDLFTDPDFWNDTKNTYDEVLSYAEPTADWLVAKKLLGTTVNAKRYTCNTLGCTAVKAQDLYKALMASQETLDFLGRELNIDGYEGVDENVVMASMEAAAAEAAAEAELMGEDEGEETVPLDAGAPANHPEEDLGHNQEDGEEEEDGSAED